MTFDASLPSRDVLDVIREDYPLSTRPFDCDLFNRNSTPTALVTTLTTALPSTEADTFLCNNHEVGEEKQQ